MCACTYSCRPAFDFMLKDSDARIFETPLNPLTHFYSIPTARNKKFAAATAAVDNAIKIAIAEKRRAAAAGDAEHDDLLSGMLRANAEQVNPTSGGGGGGGGGGGDSLDKEQQQQQQQQDQAIIDNLKTFFFGGYDTSSVAVAFGIWMISKHPEIERKMLDEIHNVLGQVTHR